MKRSCLPYLRGATTDKRTKPILDRVVGKVAPYVEALIREGFPSVYAKMQSNSKRYRYPKRSIFTGGTISFMFAKNTNQPVGKHKDKKDAKGTVGVSINETLGSVHGGNLVIDLPDGGTLTVPANHAVIAAFKELDHVVHAPTGGNGCRVSIILQQNEEVVLAAEREESGRYWSITAQEKKQMVVDGRLEMNDNEKKRYGTRKRAARKWKIACPPIDGNSERDDSDESDGEESDADSDDDSEGSYWSDDSNNSDWVDQDEDDEDEDEDEPQQAPKCELELMRERNIESNKRKWEELGLLKSTPQEVKQNGSDKRVSKESKRSVDWNHPAGLKRRSKTKKKDKDKQMKIKLFIKTPTLKLELKN